MDDVDFLLLRSRKVPLKVLYLYEEPAPLRAALAKKIEAKAEADGINFYAIGGGDPEFIFNNGLLGAFSNTCPLVDASNFSRDKEAKLFKSFVHHSQTERVLMMRASTYAAIDLPVPEDVQIVRQTPVDETTIDKILKYFYSTTTLYNFANLANKTQFREALRGYVAGAAVGLTELLQVLEVATLVNIDLGRNLFDAEAFDRRADDVYGERSMPLLLRRFVRDANNLDFGRLMFEIARRVEDGRRPAAAVVHDVQAATTKLFRSDDVDELARVFWTLLLIGWEPALIEGALVREFYLLCDAYCRAQRRAFADDQFVGARDIAICDSLWEYLQQDEYSTARRLADQLLSALEEDFVAPSWRQEWRVTAQDIRLRVKKASEPAVDA